MKILVVNSGSSSLKYQLLDMQGEQLLCKGLCERIGIDGGQITHQAKGQKCQLALPLENHSIAFKKMLELMTGGETAVLADKSEIATVGHRVVHGGELFSESVLASPEVVRQIDKFSPLAPLHNPPEIQGIYSAWQVFGQNMPQACVFDTAFHQSMPQKAFMYALPYKYYQDSGVRRYGFHGTSHRYVSAQAAAFLAAPPQQLKIITCHLGNGSSITAVNGGKSVDTSMGLTPLAGIMMGTRPGDVDPGVITYIAKEEKLSMQEVDDMLNKECGFLGVSGFSSDKRDILAAMERGDARAKLVHQMLAYQIKKYIGAYTAAMNGLDCLVFTGGIGENNPDLRKDVCSEMDVLGIAIDAEKNQIRGENFDFAAAHSKVRCLVIQTNEELVIARDTLQLLQKMG